jgi:hypothetical protein
MRSHGRIQELITYALLIRDYEMVISHYIQNAEFLKALEILTSIKSDAHENNTKGIEHKDQVRFYKFFYGQILY